YFPVVYVAPFDPNRRALGYDVLSEPRRRRAAERARDTGQMALTEPVELVQAGSAESGRSGYAMVYPIYRALPATPSLAQRRDALIGFAMAVFRVDVLFADIIPHRPDVTVTMRDGAIGAVGPVLYTDTDVTDAPAYTRDLALAFGGHAWTLQFASRP